MATEDQQIEIEMLQAIFGDAVGEVGPSHVIKGVPIAVGVKIARDPEEQPELLLTIGLPPQYLADGGASGVVPKFALESLQQYNRHAVDPLVKELDEMAAASGGGMCLVGIVQHCVNWLMEAFENRSKPAAAAVVVETDPTIRIGTQMTPEIFAAWAAKHQQEKLARRIAEATAKGGRSAGAAVAAAAASPATATPAAGAKLTGRQMWDATLKSADWSLFAGGADAVADGDAEDIDYTFAEDDDDAAAAGGGGGELNEDDYDFGEEA